MTTTAKKALSPIDTHEITATVWEFEMERPGWSPGSVTNWAAGYRDTFYMFVLDQGRRQTIGFYESGSDGMLPDMIVNAFNDAELTLDLSVFQRTVARLSRLFEDEGDIDPDGAAFEVELPGSGKFTVEDPADRLVVFTTNCSQQYRVSLAVLEALAW